MLYSYHKIKKKSYRGVDRGVRGVGMFVILFK